jgi:hypothetical protein
LASAADALVDTAAGLVTFYWVRYAERPPDLTHRFGHGKGEAVAAFTEAMLLVGAALVLAVQSVKRLIFPESLAAIEVGLWVITGSLLAALGLVALLTWVMRQTKSTAIAANRANYFTDIAANAAVLAALGVISLTGWIGADPAFALVISGYMLFNARQRSRTPSARSISITPGRSSMPGRGRLVRRDEVSLTIAGDDPTASAEAPSSARPNTPIGMNSQASATPGRASPCVRASDALTAAAEDDARAALRQLNTRFAFTP